MHFHFVFEKKFAKFVKESMLQSTKPIRNAFKRYRPNWQDAFCQQRWLARGVRSVQPLETDIDSPKSVLDNKSACDYLGQYGFSF